MRVWEVMSRDSPTATIDTKITRARALLRKSDRRIVVVLRDPVSRRMEGYVLRRDVITVTSAKSDKVLREVLREFPYALPDQDIEEVLPEMINHNIYEVPVIRDEVTREYLGSISARDIIKALISAGYRPKALVANEIMTVDNLERYILPQSERITKAWPRLVKGEVPAIIVVRSSDNRRPVGILTPKDLIDSGRWYFRRESEKPLANPPRLRRIMKRGVMVARPDTPVEDIARMMVENDFTVVPVIDEKGFVIGVVTQFDVIRAYLEGAKPLRKRIPAAPMPIVIEREEMPVYASRGTILQQVVRETAPVKVSGLTAREAALEEIPVVKITDTVEHALKTMLRFKVNHVLVVDENGRVVGSVSKRSMLHAIGIRGPLWRRRTIEREFIKEIINENLPIVYEDTPIEDVARRMVESDSEIALVVNRRGELVGIVTKDTLVEAFMRTAPEDLKVANLMAPRKIALVHPHHSLAHAVKKLKAFYLDALAVVDGKDIKGVVSVSHLPFMALEDSRVASRSKRLIWVRKLVKGGRKAGRYVKISPFLVEDVMIPIKEHVRVSESVKNAIEVMLERGVDGVPVVDEEGNPIGVICKLDVVRELARSAPMKKVEKIREVKVRTSE